MDRFSQSAYSTFVPESMLTQFLIFNFEYPSMEEIVNMVCLRVFHSSSGTKRVNSTFVPGSMLTQFLIFKFEYPCMEKLVNMVRLRVFQRGSGTN